MTTLIFTFSGGEAKQIRVTLQEGNEGPRRLSGPGEGAVGGAQRRALLVEPNGDKVKDKGKKHAKFSLTIGSQTSTGLTVLLK